MSGILYYYDNGKIKTQEYVRETEHYWIVPPTAWRSRESREAKSPGRFGPTYFKTPLLAINAEIENAAKDEARYRALADKALARVNAAKIVLRGLNEKEAAS